MSPDTYNKLNNWLLGIKTFKNKPYSLCGFHLYTA